MTYAGIQMFMDKLNQLINRNDIPSINKQRIKRQRPQFQLLYQELDFIIQTLFIEDHQDFEELNDLKKRLIYAAQEEEYNVDLFLSDVHIRNYSHLTTSGDFLRSLNPYNVMRSFNSVVNQFLSIFHIRNNEHSTTLEDFNPSLNIDDIRRAIKSVQVEFMRMKNDSSPRPPRTLNQFAAAQSSRSRNSLGSKKVLDEIFVGIDGDAELIRDKLVEDQRKLDVVSIVGMGGIGKTTLATKVFNDGYVKHHFHVRVWVTVSQTYNKRGVLTQILESISGQLDLEKDNDSRLRELVHKNLMGRRYLIVIDDIWHIETWDNLKVFFPHDNTGSRILLTSRQTEVAKHANSDGLIHHVGYLNKERSWELLCQKVFQGNECPEWSIKPGMQIVENCQGLPLAVVVIAGVLAKETRSEEFWVKIAERTSSYIVGDHNRCMVTLSLSYNHLPPYLRECFLYLGGFPEDYKFQVQRLIWLWVAEGFIQEDGNRSLEDIAEDYLMDLVDRNLVILADTSSNFDGGVKACKVHDFVRELCLEKAKEERFILQRDPQFCNDITSPYNPVRMFINEESLDSCSIYPSTQNLRTILCFRSSNAIAQCCCLFVLLRVLDLQKCELVDFPDGMGLLVNLRYLAIWNSSKAVLPSVICNLWNLQTLIYITDGGHSIDLPRNISDLVNLRHLWSNDPYTKSMKMLFFLPSIKKPMNLQTISDVQLGKGVDNFQKCFPYIKELSCIPSSSGEQNDFKSLTYLEKLKLSNGFRRVEGVTFPTSLKSLALDKCLLGCSDMSVIQSLPNLQALKLEHSSFEARCWNTDGQVFPQLKFLRLSRLLMTEWEAYSRSFPCLRQLEVIRCEFLEGIPLEMGDIPTLELIKIKFSSNSVIESVRSIEEEQRDLGNFDLKIDI
ncbi:putative P-loop containing nucleoside triphosphate hydrolase, leucine-rich repeat domain superfamily [Helianthus debilis subsp. tardiflorus]